MKIGILTFHCAHNYGAVLQAYALQEYIKSLGYDVEIIDYRPKYISEKFRIIPNLSKEKITLKLLLIIISTLYIRFIRFIRFKSFIFKKLNLSVNVSASNIENNGHDIIIIGSDQLWNPKITNGFDDVYFACFNAFGQKVKVISYAVSMGLLGLTIEQKIYLSEKLNNFNALSVREYDLKELLTPLTTKKIHHVLDPTFLLRQGKWNLIASVPKIKKKYVLIYQVSFDESLMKIATEIAKQTGAIVIEIAAWVGGRIKKNKKQYCSPEQFIGYIKDAVCIVTSSFHGTAFSIIYNRPFYFVNINNLKDGSNSRILSLLSMLNLSDRCIMPEGLITYKSIEYSSINIKLEELRGQSIDYIINNLKN